MNTSAPEKMRNIVLTCGHQKMTQQAGCRLCQLKALLASLSSHSQNSEPALGPWGEANPSPESRPRTLLAYPIFKLVGGALACENRAKSDCCRLVPFQSLEHRSKLLAAAAPKLLGRQRRKLQAS